MSREYSAIHHGALSKPKFRKLSPRGRGALLTIWLLAGLCRPVVAIWRSRAELLEALELDGFDDNDLIEVEGLRWLDPLPDGPVCVHDWSDWQRAASKDGWLDYEAARKRATYQPIVPLSPARLSPKENGKGRERKVKDSGILRKPPEIERKNDVPLKDDDDVSSEAYSKGPVSCAKCGDVILGASLRTGAGPMHQGGCAAAAKATP
jgi:hypothetical protein